MPRDILKNYAPNMGEGGGALIFSISLHRGRIRNWSEAATEGLFPDLASGWPPCCTAVRWYLDKVFFFFNCVSASRRQDCGTVIYNSGG